MPRHLRGAVSEGNMHARGWLAGLFESVRQSDEGAARVKSPASQSRNQPWDLGQRCDARVEGVGGGEGLDAVTQAGKVCIGVGR
jgi:hypothetical protein